ncbi:MAG: epoxyqueuosine reductase [Thermodesulfobacteriota bacterium]
MNAERVTLETLRDLADATIRSAAERPGSVDFWRKPLLVSARADDRFSLLKKIAAHDHLLPGELLESVKSVIVFFIPFRKFLQEENSVGKFPCRNWGLAYQETNPLIGEVSIRIRSFLETAGYGSALTPATHNFDPVALRARWSHKHLGYIAGLGRFGINAQLITPSGCAGRLGSLVTEADLGDHPLVESGELCLHKQGKECLRCLTRCPVSALGVDGIDRKRCWTRLKVNITSSKGLSGLEKNTHVCGKCVVGLPCSMDPV